jgi:hypothetical protein
MDKKKLKSLKDCEITDLKLNEAKIFLRDFKINKISFTKKVNPITVNIERFKELSSYNHPKKGYKITYNLYKKLQSGIYNDRMDLLDPEDLLDEEKYRWDPTKEQLEQINKDICYNQLQDANRKLSGLNTSWGGSNVSKKKTRKVTRSHNKRKRTRRA